MKQEKEMTMNAMTADIMKELIPTMAIIVYNNDNSYYLERRDIVNGSMAAGIPLSEDCLDGIINEISTTDYRSSYGIIPKELLYVDFRTGSEKYVWYRKPEKRRLYFGKEVGIAEGEMTVPGLVYVVTNNSTLSVYAYKGKEPKNKLYNAPFFNIYDDGNVCLGSAKSESPDAYTFDNIMKYWEHLFWESEFMHILGNNPIKGNLASITKKCIKEQSSFPEDVLVESSVKLKNLFR